MTDEKTSTYRHQIILEQLSSHGQVLVHDMAEFLQVSQETIRRDLNKLEAQKLLKKVHGGAINLQSEFERDFNERSKIATDEKSAIARKATEFIKPGHSLFMDFGTTTVEFAQQIKHIDRLTIITNAPLIADIVQQNKTTRTILLGGLVHPDRHICVGDITLQAIESFHTNYAIIGACALNPDKGVLDQEIYEAAIARKMIENSDTSIVLADSTKIYKRAVNLVTGWENIDLLITTSKELTLLNTKKQNKTKIILTTP